MPPRIPLVVSVLCVLALVSAPLASRADPPQTDPGLLHDRYEAIRMEIKQTAPDSPERAKLVKEVTAIAGQLDELMKTNPSVQEMLPRNGTTFMGDLPNIVGTGAKAADAIVSTLSGVSPGATMGNAIDFAKNIVTKADATQSNRANNNGSLLKTDPTMTGPGPGSQTGVYGGGAGNNGTDGSLGDKRTPPNPFQKVVEQNPAAALKIMDYVAASEPNNASVLALRASLKQRTGDRSGAIADAKKALALDPTNGLAHVIYGYGDEAAHAGSRTAGLLKNGFESREEDGRRGGGRAGARPGFGAQREEASEFARPAAADSQSPAARAAAAGVTLTYQSPNAKQLAAGWTGFRMGDHKTAIREATLILEKDPGDADARVLRAAAFNRSGEPLKAIADADEALKTKPTNVVALLERGYAKLQLGRYSEALTDVESALSIEPLNAMGHLYRGMILEKLDRVSDSVAAYFRAGELDPSLKPITDEATARLQGGKAPAGPRHTPLPSHGRLALYGGLALLALGFLFKGVKRAVHPSLATPMTPMR